MAIGSELWTEGNQGEACIMADDYGLKLVCWASEKDFTPAQIMAALEEKYPDVTFAIEPDVNPGTIYAVGKRVL